MADDPTMLTPNQLVAYNLARARKLRGWTQEQAAASLEPHLGELWSKAMWSAAERSVDGTRIRHFDGDEIVAFSRAFALPVGWWFMPPGPDRPEASVRISSAAGGVTGFHQYVMLDTVFGDDDSNAPLRERLSEVIEWIGADHVVVTAALGVPGARLREVATLFADGVFKNAVSDLPRWRDMLRDLADKLDQVEHLTRDGLLAGWDGVLKAWIAEGTPLDGESESG